MFCAKCGNQVPDGVRFCPKCGAALPERSSNYAIPSRSLVAVPIPNARHRTSDSEIVAKIKSRLTTKSAVAGLVLRVIIIIALFMPCIGSPFINNVSEAKSTANSIFSSITGVSLDDNDSHDNELLQKKTWTMFEFCDISSEVDQTCDIIQQTARELRRINTPTSVNGVATLTIDNSYTGSCVDGTIGGVFWFLIIFAVSIRVLLGLFGSESMRLDSRKGAGPIFDTVLLVIAAFGIFFWCGIVQGDSSYFASALNEVYPGAASTLGELYFVTAWPKVAEACALAAAFLPRIAPRLGMDDRIR